MRVVLLLTFAVLGACSGEPLPPLVAENVIVKRPLPGAAMSAGYLTLTNNSEAEIRISDVSSPQFQRVEIHESIIENGIARMRRVEELRIPAGESLSLAPGGLHLMLSGPDGDAEMVNLSLRNDATVLLDLEVKLPVE